MPIPKPNKNENKDDFVSRCIKILNKRDPDRSQDQIKAICFDTWKKKK